MSIIDQSKESLKQREQRIGYLRDKHRQDELEEQQKEDDPYAWAKARAAEQAAGELTPAPAPVPAAQPQHPGWIWDAQSNQWVADPNYQPPQQ